MTRILIPRSDNTSAKTIEASDWEKYFVNPTLYDFVICGLDISAQCPNILAVDVASGNARVKGLHLNNSTTCSVTCLTACATNKIYMTVCRDPSCEPEAWTLGTTTGCIPADSYQIATATTNAITVTAVCNVAARTTNNQFGFVGTGAELGAICPTHVGMKALVTVSGCGYGAGQSYTRNLSNDTWDSEINSFGDGADGSATNPVLSGGDIKSYTDLDIDSNTTWGASGNGPIIVRVSGTFTIDSGITLTLEPEEEISGSLPSGGIGGEGNGGTGGDGATPAASKAVVIILAKTTSGTGTISFTGNDGNNGSNAVGSGGNVASTNGSAGEDGDAGETIGNKVLTASGGGSGGYNIIGGVGGGETGTLEKYFNFSHLLSKLQYGGAGGGGRGGSSIYNAGGGGGGGGGVAFSAGGVGGTSYGVYATGAGGGGGGGGGGVSLILIAETLSALVINLTGGTGGDGGDGAGGSGGGGGGGGGGGASLLLVGLTDPTTGTVAGGTGGTKGTSTGSAGSTNGSNGGSTSIYITPSTYYNLVKRGF